MKITSLELEHVKRVLALHLNPANKGLTVIGGKNGAGKTSVLDGICFALAGGRNAPTNLTTDGAMNPAHIRVELDNGLIVERKGKNASLSVTDPSGQRGGQKLLDSLINTLALDLPRFMDANKNEKAEILLETLGIGEQLKELDKQEQAVYHQRHALGQRATAKAKHAQELPEYSDAPMEPISVSEMLQRQQAILAKNGANQNARHALKVNEDESARLDQEIAYLRMQLSEKEARHAALMKEIAVGRKTVAELQDESTAEIEASIQNIEALNSQVAANLAKQAAADEAAVLQAEYDSLTAQLSEIRAKRLALLDGAGMPLPELTVEDGELKYRGQAWDCMSGSEQLRVAVAIAHKVKPDCKFVLVDKLEQMDLDTLKEFGAWLEEQDLQCIATRVSTGEECSIVIEDGLPMGQSFIEAKTGVVGNNATTEVEDF